MSFAGASVILSNKLPSADLSGGRTAAVRMCSRTPGDRRSDGRQNMKFPMKLFVDMRLCGLGGMMEIAMCGVLFITAHTKYGATAVGPW